MFIAATIALTQTDLKRVIAYSTMSQIGYMIMAVSSGAYVAGLFHLMTHAFFKALLFMAAGSVISAMAGVQNLDKMGGFRKAMPFTFGCFIVGGLALAGVPPFSGFFSKDEILAAVGSEGGWHVILAVLGYIVAFMTAVYTFRMIFRAFLGEAVPRRASSRRATSTTSTCTRTRSSGEVEDTDVGFPGPDHHIAEREPSMKVAMTGLAILTIIGGFIQIPWVDHVLETFLEPTFAGSELLRDGAPVRRADRLRPDHRHDHRAHGHRRRLLHLGQAPGHVGAHPPAGEAAVHVLVQQVVLRRGDRLPRSSARRSAPAASRGRSSSAGSSTRASRGGASGAVRAGSAAVRAAQTGFLRYYAALVVVGMVAVTAYFLIQT